MTCRAVAVAVVVLLSQSWLLAQSVVLTVNTTSANVYQSPSTGSLVIGHATRGAVLEVTRELGSWVKVSWPAAQDRIGYIRLSMGSLGHSSPLLPSRAVGLMAARLAPGPGSPAAPAIRAEPAELPLMVRPVYVTPSTHVVGLGARVGGSSLGFGATARAWRRDRFGLQLAVSRFAFSSAQAPGVTSVEFEPSLLYSLKDHVADYVWLRPYLGSGINVHHQTSSSPTPAVGNTGSGNQLGLQVFGGGELTIPGMPRFALSADLGYHWAETAFAGTNLGGLGMSVSGHWYVK
jgi:hypothetical protein